MNYPELFARIFDRPFRSATIKPPSDAVLGFNILVGYTREAAMTPQPAVSNLEIARACFRRAREAFPGLAKPAYLLHLPGKGISWVGMGFQRIVHFTGDSYEIVSADGRTTHSAGANTFAQLRRLLDPQWPCFFLVSLDMRRAAREPNLPLMSFVQPAFEVRFGDEGPELLAAEPSFEQAVRDVLKHSSLTPNLLPAKESATAGPWQGESDELFLERLERAVETLQHIQGKMIITRSYHKPVAPAADPFRLFELYSSIEANAAACHYAALGDIHSLGCSPENVFEMNGSQLGFDVVASTRGISPDPVQDARWLKELLTDPKERKEHCMALERY